MKIAHTLTTDDGSPLPHGTRIYDKDGGWVGNYAGCRDDKVAVINTEMTCNLGDEIMGFPFDYVASSGWTLEPTNLGGDGQPPLTAPHPDEVCSSPEQVAYQQNERVQREIEGYLLDAAQLPQLVHKLVRFALQPTAQSEVRRAANAALQELVRSRQGIDADIPF